MSPITPPDFKNKLAGQTVLLLGGTGGVGVAVSHALLQSGASVILTSSRESKLRSVLDQLKSLYPDLTSRINGYACDLASPDVEENIKRIFKNIDKLNHIIYLAGDRLPTTAIADITVESFAKQSQVRAVGPLLIAKHGLSHMDASFESSFTIVSGSIASKPIPGGWSLLSFIGAGLTGLTRQLAFDLAPIRVNCVAPGVVDTDMWDGMAKEDKAEFMKGVAGQTCVGKVGQAEDVAEAFIYLLKDKHATGMVIDTNGGVFLK